jgi:hypothetical protein
VDVQHEPGGGDLDALERDLVWVLGSPRTGSSWLRRLLAEHPGIATINETYLGIHLVPIPEPNRPGEYFQTGARADDPDYLFSAENVRELRPEMRDLILKGLRLQVGRLHPDREAGPVVIKEPNGSHASDTILSLLPQARMVFLCRDGRDVLDSLLDAIHGRETWWDPMIDVFGSEAQSDLGPKARMGFIEAHARLWVSRTEATRRAFDNLPPDRRLMLRYEDLLLDTALELGRLQEWLGVEIDTEGLEAAADKHAFANIPASERGPGKEVRSATPGLWRQTFTPDEQAAMERTMGEQLRALGYE